MTINIDLKIACVEKINHKIITFSENRSKLTLINSDEALVDKVHIDGCQITEGIRCDFLLIKNNNEYYIELKGQDVKHAFEQIINTITHISADPKSTPKTSFIICTRSPLSSPEIQNMQVKLKKLYNSKLLVRSINFEYKI